MRTSATSVGQHAQLRTSGARVLWSVFVAGSLVLGSPSSSGRPAFAQEIQSQPVLPPAADIASALQRRYEAIKDFSASFTQVYESAALRRKHVESGTVYVKKPGKMRWEYTTPEKKLFISDGRTMYMYLPGDKQVMTNPVPEQDEATSAVLFLLGKGDIVRDFNVQYASVPADDAVYSLRLEPKQRQAEYDWLQVTIDRTSLQIRQLAWGDAQGGRNSISLSKFKENPGLPDKMFQFDIPRGTEVITRGRTS